MKPKPKAEQVKLALYKRPYLRGDGQPFYLVGNPVFFWSLDAHIFVANPQDHLEQN